MGEGEGAEGCALPWGVDRLGEYSQGSGGRGCWERVSKVQARALTRARSGPSQRALSSSQSPSGAPLYTRAPNTVAPNTLEPPPSVVALHLES